MIVCLRVLFDEVVENEPGEDILDKMGVGNHPGRILQTDFPRNAASFLANWNLLLPMCIYPAKQRLMSSMKTQHGAWLLILFRKRKALHPARRRNFWLPMQYLKGGGEPRHSRELRGRNRIQREFWALLNQAFLLTCFLDETTSLNYGRHKTLSKFFMLLHPSTVLTRAKVHRLRFQTAHHGVLFTGRGHGP